MEKVAPQTRIEQIEGWLNAYRQGWVSYNSAHVAELQRERQELLKAQQSA
jgi:hypothetical protein